MENDNILSVTGLTTRISSVLTEGIGFVRVRGEISNYLSHSSGHRYFTLKDPKAQISCVFWKTRQLTFTPEDGMEVIVEGSLTVYPPRGNYQIDCVRIIREGRGGLYLAFEELKAKLEGEGLFDPLRKKSLPVFPMKIGVSTSPTGAAVRDILETINGRFPLSTVYFRPTLVQGEGSAEDIARAVKELDESPAEVIIIGRGGGSIEDLWSYNTETVARAVFNANKPVISAVGHETDFTIADFTADARAATPTAAAVMVTPNTLDDILGYTDKLENDLGEAMDEYIEELQLRLDAIENSYLFRVVPDRLKTYSQLNDSLELALTDKIKTKLSFLKQKTGHLEMMCSSLQPLQPLKKGFSLLYDGSKLLGNEQSLTDYSNVTVKRLNEVAEVSVKSVEKISIIK